MFGRNGEHPTRFDDIASNQPCLPLQDSVRGVSPARLVLSSSIVDRLGLILSRYGINYVHVEVEASRREARVPREGDPVSALPTTPCVSSTSGSSPFCLLDVRLVLWGLWEAIFENNSLLSACVMSDTYPCS